MSFYLSIPTLMSLTLMSHANLEKSSFHDVDIRVKSHDTFTYIVICDPPPPKEVLTQCDREEYWL